MRKFEVESWEQLLDAELASAEIVDGDEIIIDSDWHELSCEHHDGRWELDPASAEDFLERNRTWRGPSARWRHFGH